MTEQIKNAIEIVIENVENKKMSSDDALAIILALTDSNNNNHYSSIRDYDLLLDKRVDTPRELQIMYGNPQSSTDLRLQKEIK